MTLFENELHDEFAAWATGYVGAGGADYGEITAIAGGLTNPDDQGFYDAWDSAAARHLAEADAAEAAGHHATARGHLLRAAAYWGVAYKPLFGAPVDPRLRQAFDRQMEAFERAMALTDPPVEKLSLSFENREMPAYFMTARDAAPDERRGVVILTNGYDACVSDMYLAMGAAIVDHGYHCLLFDGPGQGAMLIRDAVLMVADWERVVRVVVDAAVARDDVDPDQVVLQGWSLGGYLALRAATGEHRLAACVADPPLTSLLGGMVGLATHLGLDPAEAAKLPEISEEAADRLAARIEHVPGLRWKIIRRGFWVQGAADLREFLANSAEYTLDGRVDSITCPVLATAAENDPLAADAQQFVDSLPVPGTVIPFQAQEGAGDHCEMQNRWLANRRILDWLDQTLLIQGRTHGARPDGPGD